MTEKLKLKTGAGKNKIRLHYAALAIIVIICLAAGFAIGSKGILVKPNVADKNCIPQTDFQYFLDRFNQVQDDYQGCVSDAWALQLICKMNVATAKAKLAEMNATK